MNKDMTYCVQGSCESRDQCMRYVEHYHWYESDRYVSMMRFGDGQHKCVYFILKQDDKETLNGRI